MPLNSEHLSIRLYTYPYTRPIYSLIHRFAPDSKDIRDDSVIDCVLRGGKSQAAYRLVAKAIPYSFPVVLMRDELKKPKIRLLSFAYSIMLACGRHVQNNGHQNARSSMEHSKLHFTNIYTSIRPIFPGIFLNEE